ncbi:MAG: phage major capsid protein [Alphaproteobacteria bacterium]|nr:phage major capsid protein [Alphaproteobacteria bacterium]
MENVTDGLEIKATTGAGAPGEDEINALWTVFEQYKRDNDARLDEIDKRGAADPLIADKIRRLDAELDARKSARERAALDRTRPALEARGRAEPDEQSAAFAAYVKRGEIKALSAGTPADGGYLVPDETETEIGRLLKDVSPIRAIAGIRQVSGSVYKRPFTTSGLATGWAAETGARTTTASQTLSEISYPTMELYAMPAATQAFLDDAVVDVGQWIAEEVNAAFAEQETDAFINGTGSTRPAGFLSETQVAEASWSWGNIGYVATGVSGALPADDESDVLIDLVYALKSGYRQNASWVMNRRTQAAIRKLKDADGNYLWQPAATPEGHASFMGFRLVEAEDMPDIGAGTTPIAFGDFRRGYLVVDRKGINILRDPYSQKPYVLFYTTKRVGGGVADYDAIKLLKFAVS